MNKLHQRIGAISNAHAGAEFEEIAFSFFQKQGISLIRNFSVELGFSMKKKKHRFDFGSSDPKLIIECKSHRWTAGDKVPSAKMTVWNEAMLYFYLAPKDFKKIFFTLLDKRKTTEETLVSYYKRTYSHLIPDNVQFYEFDTLTGELFINTDL